MTDEKDALRAEARVAHQNVLDTEAKLAEAKEARYETMRRMHRAGFSWAEIGRTFECTPQAVMYGTGIVKRSPKG